MALKEKRNRVKLDFTDEQIQEIDFLKEKMRASTRTEVVRRAISLSDFLIGKKNEGYKIVLKKEQEEETIVLC